MSRPDKTLIPIQIGKVTEEQVRRQHEKHLRTPPSAHDWIQTRLNPVQSSRPVGRGAGGKPGCSGLGGEGDSMGSSFRGSADFSHLLCHTYLVGH